MIWDTLALLNGIVLLVGVMGEGYLSPRLAAVLLLGLAVFRAFARATGGVTDWLYRLFQAGFYGTLMVVMVAKGGFERAVLILIGAWGGGFESIVSRMLTLVAQGHLSVLVAALAITGLVVLRRLGLELASVFVYHTIFSYLAPLFAVGVLVRLWGQSWQEMVVAWGSVLCVLLVAEAFYLQALAVFRGTRRDA